MVLVRKHTCQTYVNYRMNFWIASLMTNYSSSTHFLCGAKQVFRVRCNLFVCLLFCFFLLSWSTQKRLSPFILKPEIEYHCWRAVSGPSFFSKLSMYVIHRNQEERTDTTKMRLIYLLSESLVEGSWLLFLVFYPKHSVIIPDRSNKLSRKAGTCIHKSKELDRNSQSTRLKMKVYHKHECSHLFLEGNFFNQIFLYWSMVM